MGIWSSTFTTEELNNLGAGRMQGNLGIRITEIGNDYLTAIMPVELGTMQPFGLLHGGASVTLAETLGSMSAWMCIDRDKQQCVGLEINANHIRGISKGTVSGTARPVHMGRSTQVWEIKICDEQNRLVCISRITMAILDKK